MYQKFNWEKPTAERFAETTLILWDVVARIKGSNPFKRPKLAKQMMYPQMALLL